MVDAVKRLTFDRIPSASRIEDLRVLVDQFVVQRVHRGQEFVFPRQCLFGGPVFGAGSIANLVVIHVREIDVNHPMRQQTSGRNDVTRGVASDAAEQTIECLLMTGR